MTKETSLSERLAVAAARQAVLVDDAEAKLKRLGYEKSDFVKMMSIFGEFGIAEKNNRTNRGSALHANFNTTFGDRSVKILEEMTSDAELMELVFAYASLAHTAFEQGSAKLAKIAERSEDPRGREKAKDSFMLMILEFKAAME